MKSKEAINILNGCVEVLEVVKERVAEIEGDESFLDAVPRARLRHASAYIDIAIGRVKIAVNMQGKADLEQHNK